MKTIENKGFLAFLNTMGWSVPVKTTTILKISNKINGFEQISYGMTLRFFLLIRGFKIKIARKGIWHGD